MKAVLLEANAVNHNDLSWEPVTGIMDTVVYDNTTEEQKIDHIGDADVIFVNKLRIDEEVFARCPKIRYIGVCATGYNVVDLEAAARHGVTVTNVPAYSTDSVAQLTWGLILESVCHVGMHSESVHNGDWVNAGMFCYWLTPITELAGKTIGIIGYGNIGRRMAEIASAFHMKVLVHTAHPEKYIGDGKVYSDEQSDMHLEGKKDAPAGAERFDFCTAGIEFVDINTLFEQSDVISLHCPLTKETDGIINQSNIDRMKDGVIIINVSRGGLVVECDLAAALTSGKVAAAGVDVVSVEPMQADNLLLSAPNITITPHMGWASVDARKRLVEIVANNLKAFLEGREENVVGG